MYFKKSILDRIISGENLVSDGAMGTMLFERGLRAGECPEQLNLSRPEIVKEIARLYIEAGADIIEANTFGASSLKLAEYKLQDKVRDINQAAVAIARQAIVDVKNPVCDPVYIAATIGPTGKILKPYGDTEADVVRESYLQQIKILVESGVDLILLQTMSDLAEITLAVDACKEAFISLDKKIPIAVSLSFNSTPRGFFTMMGISIEKAAKALNELSVDIIGSNCGNGIDVMLKVASEFKKYSKLPIIIESNAGLPETKEGGKLVYNQSPKLFLEKSQELISLGINIIGGCCGSNPEHIRAMRKAVDSSRP